MRYLERVSTFFRVQGLSRSGLEPVSFSLERGEACSLSGPSGSGKTLLLRALADLDESEGLVQLEGRPRESFQAPSWRRRVGYLPAEAGWWARTVRDHFTAWDRIDPTRLGLDRALGDASIARLSSGERQRLALLRLLEVGSDVLLLDEPTSALDQEATRSVEDLIAEQRGKGCAVIWVSHDRAQVRRVATRHLLIEAGAVREEP